MSSPIPRAVTRVTHAGVTATVITGSRAVRWLRKFSPHTGAFVLGRTVRVWRSVAASLAIEPGPDRETRVRAFAILLAHEWCHVQQFERLGWRFLPRWGGQVLANLWRELTATAYGLPWYEQPFAVLTRCAKFGQRLRAAYKRAPLELEADTYSVLNWPAFVAIVEALP